jgi:CubicO group peptidase (beta-lactamase class C family)
MRLSWVIPLLALGARAETASECPLLGPAFPAPTALSKSNVFLKATELLTIRLKEALHNGSLPSASFSVQVFSGQENHSAFTFSHTDDRVANGSVGVREVNEDSVFRIGSISKIWTMLLYMTLDGTKYFHHPVSKYVPELRTNHREQHTEAIDTVNWHDVTIGELASHQAGISRDCELLNLLCDHQTNENQMHSETSGSSRLPSKLKDFLLFRYLISLPVEVPFHVIEKVGDQISSCYYYS